MVRSPFVDKDGLVKGAWSEEEDNKLRDYVLRYGHWNWKLLPKFAGLARCGKSCRLRWYNYLKPGLKRGEITQQEHELIKKLHDEYGNKWSAIAAKIPGRTDNEIKNYWHTHFSNQKRSTTNVAKEKKKKKKIKRNDNKPSWNQSLNDQQKSDQVMYILESSSPVSASSCSNTSLHDEEVFGSLPSLDNNTATTNNCWGSSGSSPNPSSLFATEYSANICYSPRTTVETNFQDYDDRMFVNYSSAEKGTTATNCLDSSFDGFFDNSFWSEPFVLDE